jgi:hypothetical protein
MQILITKDLATPTDLNRAEAGNAITLIRTSETIAPHAETIAPHVVMTKIRRGMIRGETATGTTADPPACSRTG